MNVKPVRPIGYGLALFTFFAWVAPVLATPEPSPTPVDWELSLKHHPPARIQVNTGSGTRTYWYVLYTVTNNTGEDRNFHPEIVRVNEIESEVPADKAMDMPNRAAKLTVDPAIVGVHRKVFAAIKKLHAKTHPFLVKPVDAISVLRQGKDNALSSVAVFEELDARVGKFTIYFGGLCGERIVKANPGYNPRLTANQKDSDLDDNPKVFVLKKTLTIPYLLPGDMNTRRYAKPVLGRRTWVMR